MLWILLFAFLLSSPVLQAQDSLLVQQSDRQVHRYVKNVTQDNDVAINLWALAEVSKGRPEIAAYTRSYISQHNFSHPALRVLKDTLLSYPDKLRRLSFAAKSPTLLIVYLLAEEDSNVQRSSLQKFTDTIGFPSSTTVDYPKLADALIQDQSITSQMLPVDTFHPLHFFLFFNNSLIWGGAINKDYLAAASDNWNKTGILRTQNIGQSLYRLTLFRIYYLLDKYTEVDPLYDSIVDDPHFPVSNINLTVFRMLDYSMYRLGYYNRSLDIIREHGLPLSRYLEQPEIEIKLRIAQGSYLYYIGKIEASKKIYNEAQVQAEAQNIPFSKGYVFNNQAVNYWKSGEFDRYLDFQFRALEEAKVEDNYNLHFDILKNLFNHYRTNKDYDSAQQYLAKAKHLAQDKNDNDNLAQLSYLEGLLYRDLGLDYDKAVASFDEALQLISYENNYTSYQNILSEKARLFDEQGKYVESQQIYRQIQENAQLREDTRNSLYASFNKVNTHLGLGQMDSAKTMIDTLNTENLDILAFYQLVKARTVQARYQKQAGHPEEGIDLLQPVVEQIVKRSRGSGDLETGFWQVEPEYLDAFEIYVNLLINNDQTEAAVEALDRLKTINDAALYQNPLVRSKVLNEKELSLYKRLTEDLDVLRKQLLTTKKDQQAELQQNIDEKSAQKAALDRKITANANPEHTSVNYIQRRMDARERVLHITELNDTYYLAMISRTGVTFKKIPLTSELRSRFEDNIARIASGKTNLTELYSITKVLGLTNLPAQVHKLTIVPDSYLYELPVDILPVKPPSHPYSYGDAVYLTERFRTNYMTSLNDFRKAASPADLAYGYTGFGVSRFDDDRTALVPLPQAEKEIENISHQLKALGNKKIFLNENATEQAFRSAAPKATILHLATHSEVSGRDPMFSSIYLSKSEQDDEQSFPGRIFAYELFELNLQNDLIMLNSCESGSGSYLQGTGVVGISRALRYAGAQSLVLNLWSVNDMLASDFAVKFYEGLNSGQSKSEALRNAKLHFLKTKNANPHYWGSYMLLGNEEAIVRPGHVTKNIVAASFLIFFFSLAIASSVLEIKRRRHS